jgi:hypothetical protein
LFHRPDAEYLGRLARWPAGRWDLDHVLVGGGVCVCVCCQPSLQLLVYNTGLLMMMMMMMMTAVM